MGVKMALEFTTDEAFAERLDREDPLKRFRDRFFIPEGCIYLVGNSLGLLSEDAERCLARVMEEWKTIGIRGWLEGRQPWFYYGETLGAMAAGLIGAKPEEIVATGTTTVNIHSLVSTLYQPEGRRTKILADELNFPSDIYALRSQIQLKGLDPEEHLVLVPSRDGRFLDEARIVEMMSEEVALALFSSVLYRSGQLLDIPSLVEEAHKRGIVIGIDCSHSAGTLPHSFDEWDVDFGMWCSNKYLNGGPGGVAFLYLNSKYFHRGPALAGWFGYVKEKQFDLLLEFEHAMNAGGWQISSSSILSAAILEGSLGMIMEAGIPAIREKSMRMTSYLIYLVKELLGEGSNDFLIGSPYEEERRGGHVAIEHSREGFRICEALRARGVVTDFRPPNVMRVAPVSLYNTYHEVWKVVQFLSEIVERREYEAFGKSRKAIS